MNLSRVTAIVLAALLLQSCASSADRDETLEESVFDTIERAERPAPQALQPGSCPAGTVMVCQGVLRDSTSRCDCYQTP